MIQWSDQEEGYCEGIFKSAFFRDDEGSDELSVSAQRPELSECAEKCVAAFNSLTEAQITAICEEIIKSAEENGDEEFELPGSKTRWISYNTAGLQESMSIC